MSRQLIQTTVAGLCLGLLAACSGTAYQPAANQTQPVDLTAFVPKVDSFMVLLDTSGSMQDDDAARPKYQTAQDLVASFNNAVPDVDFNAGMVIFGKGAGTCMGNGVARGIYGMTTYNKADFLDALSSIECSRSTTPIVEAVEVSTGMLFENTGQIAAIIFSDVKWNDPDGVRAAVDVLEAEHGERLCVHVVKIGDYSGNDATIADITAGNGCGSVVNAADIADPAAMTAYAADVLMSPIAYERHTINAMTLFDFDKSDLKPEGRNELDRLADYIISKGIKVADVQVIGHTCSIGTDQYNQALSERRAATVRNYIIGKGLDPAKISAAGMGELDPIARNDTEYGRRQNRRVEIHVGSARPAP